MDGAAVDLIRRYEDEVATWGRLPAAMRLKQGLVTQVGVQSAFEIAVPHLGVPGLDHLRRRIVRPLAETARQSRHFHQLWPGGEPFVQPEPRVVGRSLHGTMKGVSRSAWLARLDNVIVRGRSSLLLAGDAVLMDYETWEAGCFPDNPEFDPGVIHADAGAFWTMESEVPALEIDEAFMLSGSHTVDFGHWMTEYLPKIAIAVLAGWKGGMPVLVDEQIPATVREALPLFLPAGCTVKTIPHLATVRARHLWCVPNPMYMGFYQTEFSLETWNGMATHPRNFSKLFEQIRSRLAYLPPQGLGRERVFLARRPNRKKKLANFDAIELIAQRRGFAKVFPEDLALVDQIRLMQESRFVVAPEGSNSFLAMFALPGAKLCTLSPPYTHPLIDTSAVLQAMGLHTTIFTGQDLPTDEFCPFWHDYSIDPESFDAFLADWLN